MPTGSKPRFVLAAALAAASIAAFPIAAPAAPGHGGGHHGGHGAEAIGEPAEASAATRTIEVELGDTYFEPESVQVKAGEVVRFVLENTGQLLHEFNIGTAAMHARHQEEMAMMMDHGMLTPTGIDQDKMKMDHSGMPGMDHGMMAHDDPNSVLVEPGQTKELVWKFADATNLEFACNVPGHYEAGMVGEFEVQGRGGPAS